MFPQLLLLLLLLASAGLAQPNVYNAFRPLSAFLQEEQAHVQDFLLSLNLSQTSSIIDDDLLLDNLEDDYSDEDESLPCSMKRCFAEFTNLKAKYRMPCSTASGVMPSEPKLPMIFPGNYDLCRVSFSERGHFCTIRTGRIIVPILNKDKTAVADYAPFGRLWMGKCMPRTCSSSQLRRRFIKGLRKTVLKLIRVRVDFAEAIALERYLESTVQVHCERDDENLLDETEVMGTTIFYFVLAMLALLTMVCTLFTACYPQSKSKPIVLFSLPRNFSGFMAPKPPGAGADLTFLNGVRLCSILWVIYGHTCLFLSGVGISVPPANPSATNEELLSPIMSVIRGGEFAVDTFFFMSGLLAMEHLMRGIAAGEWRLTPRSYIKFVVARYVRLIPVYLFVMHFYIKVLPFWGSGPYWHVNASLHDLEHTCRKFYTNIFMVNNLVPFGWEGGVGGCMGWTWYLAADFQFALLVPFLAALFQYTARAAETSEFTRKHRTLLLLLPSALLVVAQIAITAYLIWYHDIRGAFDEDFSTQIYVKPWCRIAPYALGCLYSIARTEKRRLSFNYVDKSWLISRALLGLGIATVFSIVLVTYDDMRCRAEPKSDCNAFYAWWMYGALGKGNWSEAGITTYLSLSYAAWGLGLICLSEFATSEGGKKNVVVCAFSHPGLVPLARLTYVVYLVHTIVMLGFYGQSSAPLVNGVLRQFMDSGGFIIASFLIAFMLHLTVERPINSALIWLFGFDAEKKITGLQRRASQEALLRRESHLSQAAADPMQQPLL